MHGIPRASRIYLACRYVSCVGTFVRRSYIEAITKLLSTSGFNWSCVFLGTTSRWGVKGLTSLRRVDMQSFQNLFSSTVRSYWDLDITFSIRSSSPNANGLGGISEDSTDNVTSLATLALNPRNSDLNCAATSCALMGAFEWISSYIWIRGVSPQTYIPYRRLWKR